jgi:hypothetical protein
MDIVYVEDDVLDPKFCESLIKKFEADDRKNPGVTMDGLLPDVKDSVDLDISRLYEWNADCEKLDSLLVKQLEKYEKFVGERFPRNGVFKNLKRTCYNIQKSGHYVWHEDSAVVHGSIRTLTFIWYLNTIDEGGETDFHFKSVKPVQGRFVMFPATWDYIHCGRKATNKYILTGWLLKDLKPPNLLV